MKKSFSAAKYVDRTGTWLAPIGLRVPIKVVGARRVYGRLELHVTPINGEGKAWVKSPYVALDDVWRKIDGVYLFFWTCENGHHNCDDFGQVAPNIAGEIQSLPCEAKRCKKRTMIPATNDYQIKMGYPAKYLREKKAK